MNSVPHDGCRIGLDLGSSAIKGVLTDSRGMILAQAEAETKRIEPRDGWVEVEPERLYAALCGVIRRLTAKAPGEVDALAMAAASGNTLLTDADGTPRMNIIHWMDSRARRAPPARLADLASHEIASVTGWPCRDSFPLAHLAWLREHRQDWFRNAGHYGMDTDWLLHRLSGQWCMDTSTATTFHLLDQVRGVFHEPYLQRLDIPIAKLSRLVTPGTMIGGLTAQARHDTGLTPRTRVVAGCFDHPAAARGAGVLSPGQWLFSCGTSWVGFTPAMSRSAILEAGMLCDPFLSAHDGPWGGMISVPAIGPVIDAYVRNGIAPGEPDGYRIFNECAAAASPGAGGLRLDLRLPPGTVHANRDNLSRAVMEGAARLLHEKIESVRARGFPVHEAVMVGGPARSPVWPEIVAAITGVPLRVGPPAAGALGAARLAARAVDHAQSAGAGACHGEILEDDG